MRRRKKRKKRRRKMMKRKVCVSVRESSIADKNEKRKGETESVRESESWKRG